MKKIRVVLLSRKRPYYFQVLRSFQEFILKPNHETFHKAALAMRADLWKGSTQFRFEEIRGRLHRRSEPGLQRFYSERMLRTCAGAEHGLLFSSSELACSFAP